jgi:hypothetical protein
VPVPGGIRAAQRLWSKHLPSVRDAFELRQFSETPVTVSSGLGHPILSAIPRSCSVRPNALDAATGCPFMVAVCRRGWRSRTSIWWPASPSVRPSAVIRPGKAKEMTV